jgi:hypothetical protein
MEITSEQYNIILYWTLHNFLPSKNIDYRYSAYTIHGIFERLYDRGFYIDEATIIKAMSECGFQTKKRDAQYYFNVSSQSRALQIYQLSLGDGSRVHELEWL